MTLRILSCLLYTSKKRISPSRRAASRNSRYPSTTTFSPLNKAAEGANCLLAVSYTHLLDRGYESVSLGKSRLRTETAGLTAVVMAQLARRR